MRSQDPAEKADRRLKASPGWDFLMWYATAAVVIGSISTPPRSVGVSARPFGLDRRAGSTSCTQVFQREPFRLV
ncbi:hypothetical protein AEGHOMDF_5132 [Methylobacterium soli]|nr:hypothetical protein AEGHOMDF_5132 [Methylobacterium soli]